MVSLTTNPSSQPPILDQPGHGWHDSAAQYSLDEVFPKGMNVYASPELSLISSIKPFELFHINIIHSKTNNKLQAVPQAQHSDPHECRDVNIGTSPKASRIAFELVKEK